MANSDGSVIFDTQLDQSGLKSGLSSLGSGLLKGIGAAVGAAGAGLAFLGKKSMDIGKEFETSMSQVAATMGVTTDSVDFEIMQKAAIESGAATAFSATEAAEALNYLAQAGYEAEKAADTLPAVLNLAAAGGLDLGYAASLATDAMASMGIEATNENLVHFGDQLAVGAAKSNLSVSELGEAILVAAGTATAAGQSMETMNTVLGVMSNRGIKGSEAGTHLRNVLLSLTAPTDKAAGMLDSLGVSVADSEGNIRDMNDIMGDLKSSLGELSAEEEIQALNTIFNRYDLSAVQAMMAGTGEEFDNLKAAIIDSGGAMQQMADTQMNNFEGSMEELSGAAETLGIQVFESMKAPLRDGVDFATGLVRNLGDAFNEGGFEGLSVALGDALSEALNYIVKMLPDFANMAVKLVQALVSGLSKNMASIAQAAVKVASVLLEGIVAILPELMQAAVTLVVELARGIGEALPTLIPVVIQGLLDTIQVLLDNLPLILDAAFQLVMGLTEGIIAAIPVLIEALPQIIDSIVIFLMEAIPMIIDAGIQLLTSLVDALPQIISTIVAVLPQIINSIISAVIGLIPLIIQAGIQLLISLVQALPTIIVEIVKAIPQIITSVIEALINAIPLLIQAGIDLFLAIITNLPEIIMGIVAAVPKIITGIIDAFGSLFGNMAEIGGQLLSGLWQGIQDGAGWLFDQVGSFCSDLWGGIMDFFGIQSPSRLMKDTVGKNLVLGISTGIDDEGDVAVESMEKLSEELADVPFEEPDFPVDLGDPRAMAEQFSNAVENNSQGISTRTGGAGRGNPENLSDSANSSGMLEAHIGVDGKTFAKVVTPYIDKQLGWED